MNAENLKLAQKVLRIKPEELDTLDMNLGLALLMEFDIEWHGSVVNIRHENGWTEWNPMENWQQFGEVLQSQPIVVSSHQQFNENDKPDGCYFRAHAYFSGTHTDGWDYREVVAQTCVKLLEHNLKYAD